MFNASTTLILGAGASSPYGYPVGSELRERIILSDSVQGRLVGRGVKVNSIRKFREQFSDSGVPSIDFFLSFPCNAPFVGLGKLAIAAALMECEKPNLVAGGWYADLFYHLISPGLHEEPPRLSIVTFNYDRSLEFYLHRAVKSTFRLDDLPASQWLNKHVEILHVFGDLGALPEWGHGDNCRIYGDMAPWDLECAAKGIQIIERDNAKSESFVKAQGMIEKAEFVCFLGFGFLDENTERLNLRALAYLDAASPGRTWFSSAYGISHGRTAVLNRMFPARWIFGKEEENAAEFLRRTAFLDWTSVPEATAEYAVRSMHKHSRGGYLR